MRTRILGSEELARTWGNIVDMVDRSLVHGSGSVTSHHLLCQALSGIAQVWVREDEWGTIHGVAITRFEQFATFKALAICVTTSDGWFKHGPEVLEMLEEFGRQSDCKKMMVYGRRGWKKALEKYGYKEPYMTLSKEL